MNKNKGKFYPPEWYPQQLVELAWPDTHTDWNDILPEVQECYINIITEITKTAKVLLLCDNSSEVKKVFSERVQNEIIFANIDYNDTWARDFGGITIFENGEPIIYDFAFNGWGMKFAANNDNCTNRNLKALSYFGDTKVVNRKNVVLEGGSIESDGEGTLLTTSICLLSNNRNDEWGKPELEDLLKDKFGVKKVLWLNYGLLEGDDTDGHIDTLVRFAPDNGIVYCKCTDESDLHFHELQKMEEELKIFTSCSGKQYDLFAVPLPSAIYDNGYRLPATYVNYLILNKKVLVPVYGVPEDNKALEAIQKAHPGYEIVGINCLALVKQHGSLHCITMNYPKGTFNHL